MSLALPVFRSGAVVAALAATFALLTPPPAAQAHPFGPPQTATIAASGNNSVEVKWRFGGTDDISYLAVSLDILPEDRVTLDGAVFYEDGDDKLVAASPLFHDYVLKHIVVDNQKQACTGTVEPLSDLADDGATVNYICPGPLGASTISIDMLNDLHPAYRTLVTGPDGQRAVYDGGNPVHDWTLGTGQGGTAAAVESAGAASGTAATDDAASAGSAGVTLPDSVSALNDVAADGIPASSGTDLAKSAAVQVTVVAAVIVALMVGGAIWFRIRRRRLTGRQA